MNKIKTSNLKSHFKDQLIKAQQKKFEKLFGNKKTKERLRVVSGAAALGNRRFDLRSLRHPSVRLPSSVALRWSHGLASYNEDSEVQKVIKFRRPGDLNFKKNMKFKKKFLRNPKLRHSLWGSRLAYKKNPFLFQMLSYEYKVELINLKPRPSQS